MPTLTRWFLKSALAWLAAAGLVGAAMALRARLGLPAYVAALQPVYLHMFTVGWVTQLIFGVAHWMFPKPPPAAVARGVRLGWLTWLGLNAGLALRAAGEPWAAAGGGGAAAGALAAAALLQAGAVWLFIAAIWPRVRGR